MVTKKEGKINLDSIKAIARKTPNIATAMMPLLVMKVVPLDWVVYCALTLDKQLM